MAKKRKLNAFGARLAALRKERGLTMKELSARIGISLRSFFYYEKKSSHPMVQIITDICRELDVSADELLGLKPVKKKSDPEEIRLLKKVKKIKSLPERDQQVAFHFINALIAKNRIRS